MRLYLTITITNRVASRRFMQLFQECGVHTVLGALGRGTASDDILIYLGLEATEKAVMFSIVTPDVRDTLFRQLIDDLNITSPGSGIALSMPLTSIGGKSAMHYLTSGSVTLPDPNQPPSKEEEATMQDANYQLIIAIANRGYTDMVMEAARSAGARGGTVIHAKGADAENANRFFGMSIAEEREMLFIVAPTPDKNPIMQAIMSQAGMHTKAQTICFSMAVDDTAGLYNYQNK